MKYFLTLLLFAVISASCSKSEAVETVKIGGRYSIDLPKSFKEVNNLNEEASLEYMDASRELYVIVIDEKKEAVANAIMENGLENDYTPDFTGYSQLLVDTMKPNLKGGTVAPFKDTIIDGRNARKTELDGIVQNLRINYNLGVVEGKNHFYQIMVWTSPDFLERNKTDMQDIINSFKETGRSIAK